MKRVSRRRFLKTTSATLAAAAMTNLPSRGQVRSNTTPDNPEAASGNWKGKGVLDLTRSPHAKLHQVPVNAVTVTGFWARRRQTNVASSIPSMHDELIAHGRLNNFLRLEGKSNAPQIGPVYSDSDLYKWTEAVAFVLQSQPDPTLRKTTADMIATIVGVQEPGGYLNTYYVDDRKSLRMQQHTQEVGHELYCMGHFLQAAIAYYRATGDRTMLNAGIRFVDDFLLPNYGPAPNQTPIVSGHPEIEMALIELYRTTGKRQYLDLAGYILHGDPRWTIAPRQLTYMFCGKPFTSRTHLEGHAVRAMYACCGATDYFLETGDPQYWKTLETLWHDLSEHQMYVTGGVGARSEGEAFGNPYELPNERAYGESCAAIGNMMWNARLLAATGQARFTDVIERALYNGINSGMSLDGRTYCYRNPLAFEPSTGDVIRNPWYDTTCCPPNLERTFASLPGYFYSTNNDGIYVHLYDASEMNWRLEDGTGLSLAQKTNFPWTGDIQIAVTPAQPKEFTIFLRIPGWSRQTGVRVNGKAVEGGQPGEYLAVRREWKPGDNIALAFDMSPQMIEANPAVKEDVGKLAFQRGPIVFCMEELDQKTKAQQVNLGDYSVKKTGVTTARFDPALLDGVAVLEHQGELMPAAEQLGLYRSVAEQRPAQQPAQQPAQETTLTFIPYYAWANRQRSAMQVWVPYREA